MSNPPPYYSNSSYYSGLKSKHRWEGINYSSQKDDWKKFENNNLAFAHNFLYAKKEKIYPTCV